jgi:hypothetical protein
MEDVKIAAHLAARGVSVKWRGAASPDGVIGGFDNVCLSQGVALIY